MGKVKELFVRNVKRKEKCVWAINLLLMSTVFMLASCGGAVDPASLRGGETRRTMAPEYFTGETAQAYRVAREIPEVLDSLHCYCDCKKNHGHKSLLTCFVTTHGRKCSICIDEAVMAGRLAKKGYDSVAIRKAVDKAFSR